MDDLEEGLVDPKKMIKKTRGKYAPDMESMKSEDGVPLYWTKENATKIYGEKHADSVKVWEELPKTFDDGQVRNLIVLNIYIP